MSQLIDNLNTIESVKTDIRSAIEAKGVSMSGVSFPDYPAAIASISGGGGGYTEKEITERSYDIVNLNNSASYVPSYTFMGYSLLETVSLPECVSVSDQAFKSCTSLTQVNLPMCKNVYGSAFQNCTSLTQVNLPVCEVISNNAFQSCTQFNSLTLCTDVYWTISYQSRMLSNTPIMNGTGSIYVRNDTYNNWINATGWSSLAARFVSIEYSEPILSFSDGLVYGSTPTIKSDFKGVLGITATAITEVSLPYCLYINSSTFQDCTSLSQVSLPKVKTIDTFAFLRCTSLTQIDLPNCTYISATAFSSCSSLSQVNLPNCTEIRVYAFYDCTSLTDISLPNCISIGNAAFSHCTALSQINLPNCTTLGRSVFYDCTSLEEISLPVCSNVQSETFTRFDNIKKIYCPCLSHLNGFNIANTPLEELYMPALQMLNGELLKSCQHLSSVVIDNCSSILDRCFQECYVLPEISLPMCSYIGQDAFIFCFSLSKITLGYSSVCSLKNAAFYSTPIASGTGSIYVPASLVDAYKSAQYWSTYASRIFPISE